jgi:hypothetical protein
MLQHNVACITGAAAKAQKRAGTRSAANGAHAAHAAVVGSHVVCCGAPAALLLLASGAGASIGLSAVQRFFLEAHAYLHAQELWVLILSAMFVSVGGWLEWRAHRGRRLSLFFAASVLCLALNAGVIFNHRGHSEIYSVERIAR